MKTGDKVEKNQVTVYVVTFSGGSARISSVKAVEKSKVYKVVDGTQENYFGWQYIGGQVRKDRNVFTSAKEAAQYAIDKLATWIERQEEEINEAKMQKVTLFQMLNKAKEE